MHNQSVNMKLIIIAIFSFTSTYLFAKDLLEEGEIQMSALPIIVQLRDRKIILPPADVVSQAIASHHPQKKPYFYGSKDLLPAYMTSIIYRNLEYTIGYSPTSTKALFFDSFRVSPAPDKNRRNMLFACYKSDTHLSIQVSTTLD